MIAGSSAGGVLRASLSASAAGAVWASDGDADVRASRLAAADKAREFISSPRFCGSANRPATLWHDDSRSGFGKPHFRGVGRKELGGEQPKGVFEIALERLHEVRGVPAVDHAMVAGKREVHAFANLDLAVNDDDLFLDLVDRDDRDFGAVDHRGRGDPAHRAEARQGDG